MRLIPTKDHPTPPTPPWMRVGLVGFIVLMALVGYQNEQRAKQGDEDAVTIKKYDTLRRFGDLDEWHRTLNPSYAKDIEFEILKEGEGEVAACGQQVRAEITPLKVKKKTFEPQETIRLSFRLGDGTQKPAYDKGLRGMKKGEDRRIWAGARLMDPSVTDPDAKPHIYDALVTAIDPLPALSEPVYQRVTVLDGAGVEARCGQSVRFSLKLLDGEKVAYASSDDAPLEAIIGQGRYGHGMDRTLLGMVPGDVRRALLPPSFLPASSVIPFVKGRPAQIEITRLADAPANPENATSKNANPEDNSHDGATP